MVVETVSHRVIYDKASVEILVYPYLTILDSIVVSPNLSERAAQAKIIDDFIDRIFL
jgi:hypothetical protein